MTAFTIDELPIPATLDGAGGADFVEMTRARNEIEAGIVGSYDLAYEPAELLPNWQNPYNPQRLLLPRVDGRIVGRGIYQAPIEEGSRDAWLSVEVLPEFRRRGIGSALYDRLVAMAREQGRTVLQCYIVHRDAAGERIPSPTGFGSVPRDTEQTRFLTKRGYALGQVERVSRLALPVEPGILQGMADAAAQKAGADYRTVTWQGRTPEHWLPGMAELHRRMSTDTPAAEMEFAEEAWDVERVRVAEELREQSGRVSLLAAVEHLPSGALVAFSELFVPAETERAVEQHDTLVLREHRGRRLGMLVKATNLLHLERTLPGHPSVTTFNAEENRYMLDVNEAVGFAPIAYAGGWKQTIS